MAKNEDDDHAVEIAEAMVNVKTREDVLKIIKLAGKKGIYQTISGHNDRVFKEIQDRPDSRK